MPKRTLSESLLGFFAGRDRAAVIYGDLAELGTGRGRGWFVTAYLCTLISFGRRPVVAFVAGAAAYAILSYNLIFPMLFFVAWGYPHIGEPFGDATLQLWFLAPFALIRYGIRDRAVQMVLAASLLFNGELFVTQVFPGLAREYQVGLAVAVAFGIAVAGPWRRYVIPGAASCAVGSAVAEGFYRVSGLDWTIPGLAEQFPVIPGLIDTLTVAIVFSWLHAWVEGQMRHTQIGTVKG